MTAICVAFTASTPTALAELFVRDADGTERQLTRLGADFRAAVPARAPEHVTVNDVDGWIMRPEGDRPFPVLLSINGGPMSQ